MALGDLDGVSLGEMVEGTKLAEGSVDILGDADGD